jgi:hypothetical protein
MSDAAGGDDAVDRDEVEVLAGHLWQAVSLRSPSTSGAPSSG